MARRSHVLVRAVLAQCPSRALGRCLMALALVMPGAAYPLSLQQLLQLQLEELMQLRIIDSSDAKRPPVDGSSPPPASPDRSRS